MTQTPSWIGERPSAPQIFALMFCGVTGLMIPGLQPLLLGGLAEAGRVAPSALGRIATAELLAMGLTAGIAGSVLKASRLKLWAIGALAALAFIDAITPFARGEAVTLARALAGVPSGILVWITISYIARTPTPERWAGVYVTAQTLAQFLVAAVLSALITARWGADGGFLSLSVLCALNALLIFWLPASLAPLPEAATAGLPNLRGWLALAVSFLFLGATSGAWVFVGQLSNQAHHQAGIAGLAVSLSLACQVLGGSSATALAGRISAAWTLFVCALGGIAVFAGFATLPTAAAFLALAAVLGFVWLFSNPFLVPLTIEADPSRRAALLIGGAQLIGGSLGPLLASLFVTDADARGALGFGAGSFAVAASVVVFLHLTRPRQSA
jgi:hypothetical protein